MADVSLDEVRARWVGVEFDRTTFEVDERRMLDWAAACGETDPRFTDPSDPDFQAQPLLVAMFNSGQFMPDGFPELGDGQGIDGGKGIEVHGPIRAGDTLVATSRIADIYEKTGRSGTMIFLVHRMEFVNQRDEPVATVDWRMIRAAGS